MPTEPDAIDGWPVRSDNVPLMTNCRLKRTRDRLAELLALVDEEIGGRQGKGGGGLK